MPIDGGCGIRGLALRVSLRRKQSLYSKLTSSALHAYGPVVQMYSNQLVNVIDRDLDQPIDITRWLSYYAFDVMGNLAFGKTFDMIRDGKESYFLQTIRTDMGVIGYLKHQPWLFPLFAKTPLVNANHLAFWKWIEDRMTERINVVTFSYLIVRRPLIAFSHGKKEIVGMFSPGSLMRISRGLGLSRTRSTSMVMGT